MTDKALSRPVTVAERFEDAGVGSLVYVDERGQVQSRGRYRTITVTRFAASGMRCSAITRGNGTIVVGGEATITGSCL